MPSAGEATAFKQANRRSPSPASRERGGAAVPMMSAGPQRRVWRLAGPIILSNLSVPLLGAVDTAVVGHLPDAA